MTTLNAGTAAARARRADPFVSQGRESTPDNIDDWRRTANTPIRRAARIAGVSAATLYQLHHKGDLELRKIGGVTLVPTPALARLIDDAEKWSPHPTLGVAARKARVKRTAPTSTASEGANAA